MARQVIQKRAGAASIIGRKRFSQREEEGAVGSLKVTLA